MTVLLWIRSYAQKHQVFVPIELQKAWTLLRWINGITGPAWLLETNEWPIQPETLSREETFATISHETKVTIDLTRFSSYVRLRNVVTTVLS